MQPDLIASGSLFARIFNASPVAMGIFARADGRCVAANEAFGQLFGYSLAELIGRGTNEVGLIDTETWRHIGQTVLESGQMADRPLRVRARDGSMIPISSLAEVKFTSGPDSLDRFNNLPAVKILGQAAPGVSSGQAIARVEQIAAEVLPPDFSFDWGGTSYQEKRSGGASTFALVLAVIMVFLILSAQYERWSLPLSVLLALPFGTFGALAGSAVNAASVARSVRVPLMPRSVPNSPAVAKSLSNKGFLQSVRPVGVPTAGSTAARDGLIPAINAVRGRFRPPRPGPCA